MFLFRERTIHRFISTVDSRHPWRDLVLQLTVTDMGVRSAAIALAASAEGSAPTLSRSSEMFSQATHNKSYIVHYNRAIKTVRDTLASTTSLQDDRLIPCLVANSLFTAIELSRDTLDLGFVHIQSGLRIARSYMNSVAGSKKKPLYHHILALRRVFVCYL